MANNIQLITKFTPKLDAKFRQDAKTGILEADETWYRETRNAKTIEVAKVSCDGMGDYSRTNGYTDGDITINWEQHTFSHDRGRRFNLDVMDEEESLASQYFDKVRYIEENYVIPEIDATRFATIASTTGVMKKTGALSDSTTKEAINTAIASLEENECDTANLVIFATPTVKGYLDNEVPRSFSSGQTRYNQKIDYYNEIPLISVPQRRFYTAIDLYDGTSTGETAGGYVKHVATGATGDVAGKDINFIIMDKSAAFGIVKHSVAKVMPPEQNPFKDGYLIFFRYYHDLFALEQKVDGIYVHHKA